MKRLEYKTDLQTPDLGQTVLAHARDVVAIEQDRPRAWSIQTGDQSETDLRIRMRLLRGIQLPLELAEVSSVAFSNTQESVFVGVGGRPLRSSR